MIDFRHLIQSFFSLIAGDRIDIYNEFSLQHEFGIYLRSSLNKDFKLQFELPVSFFGFKKDRFEKKEIDISVINSSRAEKYAIELKFPRNGQYPEQMFKACQDIRFLEQLFRSGFDKCFFIMVADDPLFYRDGDKTGIYRYFRAHAPLHGIVLKPTGKQSYSIELSGTYNIVWNSMKEKIKYSMVDIHDKEL